MPFVPTEIVSGPAVPRTVSRSAASPRRSEISISDVPDSAVAPGANGPPERSIVTLSTEPAAPVTRIVSVFVVVAAPQATGSVPNRICAPATSSVAVAPGASVAFAVFRAASYVQPVAGGGGGVCLRSRARP